MVEDKEILLFAGARAVTVLFKHDLDLLAELKKEHDTNLDKLHQSLEDYEAFLREKGVDVELTHLANHADYLDDNKMSIYRKRILDFGNALKRELTDY